MSKQDDWLASHVNAYLVRYGAIVAAKAIASGAVDSADLALYVGRETGVMFEAERLRGRCKEWVAERERKG